MTKISITIPTALLAEVDAAACERGQSRSEYVAAILRAAVRPGRDADVTRRLDAFFASERNDDTW